MAKKIYTYEQRKAIYEKATDDLLIFAKDEIPKMGNWTPEAMVDMCGRIKLLEDTSKKIKETLNGLIDSRMTPGTAQVTGDEYVMTIRGSTRSAVSKDLAIAKIQMLCGQLALYIDMPPEAVARHVADIYATTEVSSHFYDQKEST